LDWGSRVDLTSPAILPLETRRAEPRVARIIQHRRRNEPGRARPGLGLCGGGSSGRVARAAIARTATATLRRTRAWRAAGRAVAAVAERVAAARHSAGLLGIARGLAPRPLGAGLGGGLGALRGNLLLANPRKPPADLNVLQNSRVRCVKGGGGGFIFCFQKKKKKKKQKKKKKKKKKKKASAPAYFLLSLGPPIRLRSRCFLLFLLLVLIFLLHTY
jgi:hypothetical protein